MYPEITPHIRDLIKFRYRLMPYLYDLLWRSHSQYEPMIRPTFHDFPEDARCYEEGIHRTHWRVMRARRRDLMVAAACVAYVVALLAVGWL